MKAAALPAAEPSVRASAAMQLKLWTVHAAPAAQVGAMEGRSVTHTPSAAYALDATTPKGAVLFFR